jgi:1-acyl-sn-glycerol-3-phosphate acyltransferase
MFHRVWLKVEGPLPQPADGPMVFYMNHPGWWDGYMAFLLDKIVLRERFESYIMMEEKQLRAYRFFTLCGAFSVDRRRPGEAERSFGAILDPTAGQDRPERPPAAAGVPGGGPRGAPVRRGNALAGGAAL